MTSAPLASVLRSGRDHFNTRFAEARRRYPDLDAAAFQQFLLTEIDPLARAVDTAASGRTAEVVMAAYDAALDLLGQKLVGPGARDAHTLLGWRKILPQIPAILADSPARVIAGICNALHQLASTSGARPADWIDVVARLGSRCGTPDTLLRLGQTAAWRAGLAHFRDTALTVADELPHDLALAIFNAPASATWPDVRENLRADRWFDPAAPLELVPSLRLVREAGAFRGLGGLFIEPPRVSAEPGEHYLVVSGGESWLLTADAFGATFHRATEPRGLAPPPLPDPHANRPTARDFSLVWSNQVLPLTTYGRITSIAAHATTAAVSCAQTHAVLLIAKGSV